MMRDLPQQNDCFSLTVTFAKKRRRNLQFSGRLWQLPLNKMRVN